MFHGILTGALVASLAVPSTPSVLKLASSAGRDISARVFLGQQTSEAERRCRAEADRERDACEREGRRNCDELHESHLAVCLAAVPASEASPSDQEEPARSRPSRRSSGSGWSNGKIMAVIFGALALLALADWAGLIEDDLE